MKSYVTGATGFLGKHLVKALEEQGHTISSIPHELISNTKLGQFDNFFFLSTYGNMYFHDDLDKVIKSNLLDLITMIKQAVKFKFKSFIYISTSSVKLEIQTPYSRMKKAAEEVLLMCMEKYHLPICIIRPLSITGVGEQKEHLIPTLIRSCFTNEQVNFVPDATHDYIDVLDVVEAIQCLSSGSRKGIYEVGTGIKTTNDNVLEIVERLTGKQANINLVQSLRSYDSQDWFSTNYKMRSWGWLPHKTLEQSIKEQIEAYE
jgi:nucleoside-diphosphate-sugar epimerase